MFLEREKGWVGLQPLAFSELEPNPSDFALRAKPKSRADMLAHARLLSDPALLFEGPRPARQVTKKENHSKEWFSFF